MAGFEEKYLDSGLNAAQVEESRRIHGSNALKQKKKKSFFKVFLSAFSDPIIRILLGAVAVNVLISQRGFDAAETLGIVAAVLISCTVTAFSEYRSEKGFERLKSSWQKARCLVKREGKLVSLPCEELVVGDLAVIRSGERIPADGILLSGEVKVDQSALNGESAIVGKAPLNAPVTGLDSTNGIFKGTVVAEGKGLMRVTSVGDDALYGRVASQVQEESPESPMRLRLKKLASNVSSVGYVAAALVATVYFCTAARADPTILSSGHALTLALLEALTVAVTVLVVAVPEGLPMMITVVLSGNMKRMLKDKVIVRKAVGIETAGSLNILFCDKTGTLTEGKMSVTDILISDGRIMALSEAKKECVFDAIAKNCVYDTLAEVDSQGRVSGSTATDRALLEAVLPLKEPPDGKVVRRISFDSSRKYSAAEINGGEGAVYFKGAREVLLPLCKKRMLSDGTVETASDHSAFLSRCTELEKSGARIVVICQGKGGLSAGIPRESVLVGAAVISDGVRKNAAEAVRTMQNAGVKVVMVTGDNLYTAKSVAKKCGIISKDDLAIEAKELDGMSDGDIKKLLSRLRLVARALPSHKTRLVSLAREMGLVTGMTGDGINDAAALKAAHVGFAMGSGSDIAKDAGDIIISDDRFESIVKAVLHGRNIFKSIRKFIMFQLTMNLCAVAIGVLGPTVGINQPITVLQMLWVNLIMDTVGGIAFSGECARGRYMNEAPKRLDEPIVNASMALRIALGAVATLGISLWFLQSGFLRSFYGFELDSTRFLTAFFVFFIFAGIFNCFYMRSPRLRMLDGVCKNRLFIPVMGAVATVQLLLVYYGGEMARTVALSAGELGLGILIALAVIPAQLILGAVLNLVGFKNEL